jgi:hypothetical protein
MATETKDVITLIIAAYGAVLSSFNLWQALTKDRRRILLKQSTGFYTYAGGGMGPAMATFEVINQGYRPVVVEAPIITLPSGKHMVLLTADGIRDFPKRLEDGDSVSLRVPFSDIAAALKKEGYSRTVTLYPICKDSTGNIFKGKIWRFDVKAGWTKMPIWRRLLNFLRGK